MSNAPMPCSATPLLTDDARSGGSTTPHSSSISSRARSISAAPPGESRAIRCWAGSAPAISWPTAMHVVPRAARDHEWEKYGRGRDERCATAWPTAVTSRLPSSPPRPRCANRSVQPATAFGLAETSPPSTDMNVAHAAPGEGDVFLTERRASWASHVLAALLGRGYRVRALVRDGRWMLRPAVGASPATCARPAR